MAMSLASPSVMTVADALAATGPVTITQLAHHTGLARSTVAGALKALEAGGLATRSKGTGTSGNAPAPDLWSTQTANSDNPATEPADTPEPSTNTPPAHNPKEEETTPAHNGDGHTETETETETEAEVEAEVEVEEQPVSNPAEEETETDTDTDPHQPAAEPPAPHEPADDAPSDEDADSVTATDPGAESPVSSSDDADAAPAETPAPRLKAGQLREQVKVFFATHPGHEVTAGDVARLLTRSAGAVHNAIQRLITEGVVRQVGDNPRRYTAT